MLNSKSKTHTHNKKILDKPENQNTQKCNCINKNTCVLNGNYLHPVYSNNKIGQKELPEIIKELLKTHSENDTQTIKDHSASIDIKTIRNNLSSTGT